MKKILVYSGPLIALFNASDKHHARAIDFIKNNDSILTTTIVSITETLDLLNFNRNAQIDFLEWINQGAVEIYPIENKDFGRIKELTIKYSDLPMDFADACLVLLAEKLDVNQIATIDRDFTIYKIKGRKRFKVVLL